MTITIPTRPTRPRPVAGGTMPLAAETMVRVRRFFDSATTHRPSGAQWSALEDLARCLETMARGEAEPTYYLSSIDPGMGKTSVLTTFVDVLLSDRTLYNVGVIICLSRLSEIKAMVERMTLPLEWTAVVTADEKINALGCAPENHDKARVLFTTQAMVEKRSEARGGSFARAEEFWYQGRPRIVRAWDESALPARSVTLAPLDLYALPRVFLKRFPTVAHRIKTMAREVETAKDDALYEVPDLEALGGPTVHEAIGAVHPREDDVRAVVAALWLLQGTAGRVRHDGLPGNTLLDFAEALPSDLAPMVILDASGRVRSTYDAWERHRGGLTRLKTAPKTYRNLTIKVWSRSGGKTAYVKAGEALAAGVAETILKDTKGADDPTLLVIHKRGRVDMEAMIRSRLPAEYQSLLHFTTWGKHTATNDYANVRRVFLVGTLFLPTSGYEALGRAASGRHAKEGPYPAEDRHEIARGEHRHLILQALCRAAVRKSVGSDCAPCTAYLIASKGSGIKDELPTIFPGATIESWTPTMAEVHRVLRGKVKAAVDAIAEWLEFRKTGDDLLAFSRVQSLVGVKDSGTFKNDVRDHPDFKRETAQLGLEEWGKGKRKTHWKAIDRLADAVAAFPGTETAPGDF